MLDLQKRVREETIAGKHDGGVIFVLSHNPVITMGIRGRRENILMDEAELTRRGIETVKIRRGGDVTYHDSGQCIFYPVVNFKLLGFPSVRTYVTWWGQTIAVALSDAFGIGSAHWDDDRPGVWTDRGKIASVGFHFKKFVAIHGIAVNINPDSSVFKKMHPCGMKDVTITSIYGETGRNVTVTECADPVLRAVRQRGAELTPWKEDLQ